MQSEKSMSKYYWKN